MGAVSTFRALAEDFLRITGDTVFCSVFVDGVATWVDDDAEQADVWELFLDTPTPLG